MAATLTQPATVTEFLALTGDFLVAHEAEHNLILGLAATIEAFPETFPGSRFYVALQGGTVAGAALQTPPRGLIVSGMDAAVAEALADAVDPASTPSLLAQTAVARAFVDRFRARTGRTAKTLMSERIFRLDTVIAPRPAPGRWRFAEERDRARLVDLWVAFAAEALPEAEDRGHAELQVDRALRRVGRRVYVWEDGGELVCFAGAGGLTPHGIRIGPVYTPPEARGRGHASCLVAAISQDQLDAGRRFVFLFTNLANPTSNKIYQALGYRGVCDVEQILFGDP